MERREFEFLEALVYFIEAKSVVEVGVLFGDMAVYLCRAAQRNKGHYAGFDVWDTHGLKNQFKAGGSKESVTKKLTDNNLFAFELMQVDTVNSRDLFEQKLDTLFPNGIDFAFIDACHSYKGIANDFFVVYPRLSPVGVVAFHDTLRIDGCREFMFDLCTKLYDGTFDLIDLPFGSGERRCGVSILSKRSFPVLPLGIDEVCGSLSESKVIEREELIWYNRETQDRRPMPNECVDGMLLDKIGHYPNRKKFE